jgi:competence protein ComFC
MEILFNLLFPQTCFNCKKHSGAVCKYCLSLCKESFDAYCIVCGKSSDFGRTHDLCLASGCPTRLFSCFEYSGLVRDGIRKSKYHSKEFSILKTFAKRGVNLAYELGLELEDFIVVPIPLSKKKEKERGFNQAEMVADFVCRKFRLPKTANFIKRVKDTEVQYKQTRIDRMINIRGAFKASHRVKNKKILLVDDICTTGATLIEASKALMEAGANEVQCFVLARTPTA